MSLDGFKTCPHCRALVTSSVCAICGRSADEEVAPRVEKSKPKWTDGFEHDEHRKVGVALLVVLVIGAVAAFLLTRDEPAPTATSLPPPASTTTTSMPPPVADAPPSLGGGARPATGFVPGAPREVGEGLAPWETPPPIDFVGGGLLDERAEHDADIARVQTVLDAVPDPWGVLPLDPPELVTLDGTVDLELVETTQPFAARTLVDPADHPVATLWLIASSGSDDGDAYLSAARTRWDTAAALEQFAPELGVRLSLLARGDTVDVWATALDVRSLVLLQTPTGSDPAAIATLVRDWRAAIDDLD